jgi:hypothetical protein
MLSGVMAGGMAAFAALAIWHSPLSVALAYCLAGLIGSTAFSCVAALSAGTARQRNWAD